MFKLDWIAMALAATLTGSAWALGGSDGGGGNGAEGQILEATYRATDRLPEYKKYKAVRDFVANMTPRFAYRMDKFALALEWTLIKQNLPYQGNDIDYLVPTQQTAVQHDGLVYVDMRIAGQKKFTSSWPMLITHEILLRSLLARNVQFKLGLSEQEIHHAVRSVVFRLFDFASRPHPEFYEIPLQTLLEKNHFGRFAYKSYQDMAIAELPEAIQKIAIYVDEQCRAGKSDIADESLRNLEAIAHQYCKHCDQNDSHDIFKILEVSEEVFPLGELALDVTGAYGLKAIHLVPQSCPTAKTLATRTLSQAFLNERISSLSCPQFTGIVPGETGCDSESGLFSFQFGRSRVQLDP